MRLLALTVATAAVLTFAFPQTRQVLAQSHDDGAVGRPLQLDGGPSLGSDNHEQIGSRSEGAEPSAGSASKKSQTDIEKTGETAIRERPDTHVRWRAGPRRGFATHKRSHHFFAFHVPRHGFVIHRHGRRFVAFNEPSGA